jgi:hypothetical protein
LNISALLFSEDVYNNVRMGGNMSKTTWTSELLADDMQLSNASQNSISSTSKRKSLYKRFKEKISHNSSLDRTLVSFQGNRDVPFYSWFKYREGFSEQLVKYLLMELMPKPGVLLDPFAGSGAALFAAGTLGWQTKGIEVLPVGIFAMQARIVANRIHLDTFHSAVTKLSTINFADYYSDGYAFRHIAISRGAFPAAEERELIGYISYCHQAIVDEDIRTLMLYAAFCILEEMSYTRKDGQFLRWDARSGRSLGGKPRNLGRIVPFREALDGKLTQMTEDLGLGVVQQWLFPETSLSSAHIPLPELIEGSCLTILPTMADETFDFILTSPPYANRYDYTRTYALELVFLGCGDEKVKQLRQTMLSCTVENRDKRAQLQQYYAGMGRERDFQNVGTTFERQEALQEVLAILDTYREKGKLNNANVARLVRNYFYEMCFVIYELARLLKRGGIIAMVNDNVRYAGEEVPVDLILSDFAESFGLSTRHIWTLGRGKGNSSQQMGMHGREELRKCVYVWEKPL